MSLEILQQKGKRALCKCTVCGVGNNNVVSMIYNLSDIESGKAKCRMCEFLKRTGTGNTDMWRKLILDEANYKKLMLNEVCSLSIKEHSDQSCFKTYPLGQVVGDGTISGVVTKYKGINSMGYPTYYMSGYQYAVRCKYCNCTTFVANPKDFSCPICTVQRQKTAKIKAEKLKKKNAEKDFNSFDILRLPKEGSKMDKSIKNLKKINPKFDFLTYSAKGGMQYKMVCKRCGNIETVTRANARIKECAICDSEKRNTQGVLMRDYVGTVKLGLVCIAQDKTNFTCTLMCPYCERKHDGIALYDFLNSRFCCDCEKSNEIFQTITCDKCYKPLRGYSMVDYLKKEEKIMCSCGCDLTEEVDMVVVEFNASSSLRTKIRMANEVLNNKDAKNRITFTRNALEPNELLVTEAEPLYRGNVDGKLYKRCYCQKHNIALILNEDEILGYNHEHCKDSRQGIVADMDLSNLKLD